MTFPCLLLATYLSGGYAFAPEIQNIGGYIDMLYKSRAKHDMSWESFKLTSPYLRLSNVFLDV